MNIHDLIASTVTRNDESEFADMCADWTLADWSNALCGEAGEAANVVKKIRRGDFKGREDVAREKLGKELADVLAYAFLLANQARIDLPAMYVAKFNEVAQSRKFSMRMSPFGKLIHADPRRPGTRLESHELIAGKIVRYDSGSTALMRLISVHAGGWHGAQCMGGTVFAHGPFHELTEEDEAQWRDCARWRNPMGYR